MERISNYQLFALLVFFQLGTTLIFGFAASSGRDAWITVLISTAIGVLQMIMFTTLFRLQPGLTLVEWFPAQLGKWLGTPIAWMFPLLFFYGAARMVTDLRDLIQITILRGTPPIVYLVFYMLIVSYAIYAGIEVLGRLAECWLPPIFLLVVAEAILVFSSEIVHFEYLQPVLYEGWAHIWQDVFPLGVTQSFGESILFAMLWTSTHKSEKIMRTCILAVMFSGIMIAFLDMLAITVLGENTLQRAVLPLFLLLQQIRAGIIENLDAIGVMYLIITTFFKMSFYIYAAVRGIQRLTYINNSRLLILPVVSIVLFMGMTMSSSLQEHLEAGLKNYPLYLQVPLYLVLPTLLLIIIMIRKAFGKFKKGLS